MSFLIIVANSYQPMVGFVRSPKIFPFLIIVANRYQPMVEDAIEALSEDVEEDVKVTLAENLHKIAASLGDMP
jgi:hypothetical protein